MIINHMNQIDTLGGTFVFWEMVRDFAFPRLCNDPSNQIKGEFTNQGSANGWMLLVCVNY
jgi:hypothetical protein